MNAVSRQSRPYTGWIVASEHNVDEWPNAELASLPGRPGMFSYAFITLWLLTAFRYHRSILYFLGIVASASGVNWHRSAAACAAELVIDTPISDTDGDVRAVRRDHQKGI